MPRWEFLRSPGLTPYWLAILVRLHAGIVRSFATEDAPAPLMLDLDASAQTAVDVYRWMPIWRDLRALRQRSGHQRTPLPFLEDPGLRVLLAARAELLEALGRPTEAAAAWRDVAAAETDADAAAIALEIARRLRQA